MYRTVSVLVATYGDDDWGFRGTEAASHAAEVAKPDEVIQIHGDNLAAARNNAASLATGDLIVFLDADDRLSENYCKYLKQYASDDNILYKPSVQICIGDNCSSPSLYQRQDLLVANELVVGTAMKRDIFTRFDESLDMLEDWEMFLNVIATHDAKIQDCSAMIYIYNQSEESRNSRNHHDAYKTITTRYSSGLNIRRVN
jgi:glycosyltransferase involved in cell wall biosynthesis